MTDHAGPLEPMPDLELIGHPLDLCRPELSGLMHRYTAPHPMALVDPPIAVIVTRFPGEEIPFRDAFEKDGWTVKTCPGPGQGNCPLMRGERCELRSSADAAVVFVDPKATPGGGNVPRFCCAVDGASPGVVALEGRLDPPTFAGRIGVIGALRGPEALLHAITSLRATEQP